MSDPLRTDSSRALDAASDADRDAKIEQLLLVGLDHYFASQYDHAINVWTRALFLDRSHPRARAYIDRARSALAERQRESEELLQNGVAAFQRGEGLEARRLLQAAIAGGAPADEALAVLERLDRLEAGPAQQASESKRNARRAGAPLAAHAVARPTHWLGVGLAVIAILGASGVGAVSWAHVDWRAWLPVPIAPAASAAPVWREITLPLPRHGETTLARARTLALGGRLRDALAVLDTIQPTDPVRAAADRLRADLQRQLLALSSVSTPDADVRDTTGGRVP
jgi:tetratricopeptide (TPR) repeat protein